MSISSPAGGGGPAPSLATSKSVTTTITDDDAAPTGITLSADPSTLGEDDAATSVTVTATLNGGTTRTSATVVTIGALSGSATKDTDYTVTSLASITIPANSSTGTGSLTITPTDDMVVEGDETITIPGTTTTQVGLDVTSATVTLTDDDKGTDTPGDKDSAEISIAGPSASVNEGGNATFTVTLSKAVDAQVQVAWSAPLGTDAAEGSDLRGHVRDGDVCGELGCGGDPEYHHRRHRRQALGDGRGLHRDAGGDHVQPVIAVVPEERRKLGDGDDRGQRSNHHQHQRVPPTWTRVTRRPTTRCRCRRPV